MQRPPVAATSRVAQPTRAPRKKPWLSSSYRWTRSSNPAPPVRQLAEVWFHRLVLVGRAILQGRYVIEHDNDRMARGEPCTHIYAFNDRTRPVVAFRCTHLERGRADQNTVSLATAPDGLMKVLTEFQFAGETAAHGYPTVR